MTVAIEARFVGSFVGPYRISGEIGVGGMGIVYEAVAPDGTCVALKMLRSDQTSDTIVRRFHDEGVAGLAIDHQNIASTLARARTDDGVPFLVMERIRGEMLAARINTNHALSLLHCVAITRQILAGLEAMHACGIVHGDVKSDNIMIETRNDGREIAKLIDLGLAHVQFDPRPPTTPGTMIAGTPEYMAPELVRGAESSAASDLYAVGIVLYELITGSTPFVDGTSDDVLRHQLEDPVVPPSLRRPSTPPILDRIVMRALAKAPEDRFPSAAAFSAALLVAASVLDDHEEPRNTPAFSHDTATLDWVEPRRARHAG